MGQKINKMEGEDKLRDILIQALDVMQKYMTLTDKYFSEIRTDITRLDADINQIKNALIEEEKDKSKCILNFIEKSSIVFEVIDTKLLQLEDEIKKLKSKNQKEKKK